MKSSRSSARPWVLMVCVVSPCAVSESEPILLGAYGTPNTTLLRIDPGTGAATPIGPTGQQYIGAMAWDAGRGILYATNPGDGTLLRINPSTGLATQVGSFLQPTKFLQGLAYDSANDVLYGMGNVPDADLYTINRSTGEATFVGHTGIHSAGDLAYDYDTDTLYMSEAAFDVTAGLCTLNRSTGAATRVGVFGAGSDFVGVGLTYDHTLGLLASNNGGFAGATQTLYHVNPSTGAASLIGTITNSGNVLALAVIPAPNALALCGMTMFFYGSRRRAR